MPTRAHVGRFHGSETRRNVLAAIAVVTFSLAIAIAPAVADSNRGRGGGGRGGGGPIPALGGTLIGQAVGAGALHIV